MPVHFQDARTLKVKGILKNIYKTGILNVNNGSNKSGKLEGRERREI